MIVYGYSLVDIKREICWNVTPCTLINNYKSSWKFTATIFWVELGAKIYKNNAVLN